MQLVHWPVTQRVICEWVNLTNLRLATVTNGETPPMSKVTTEINLVPKPHPCTQCKEPGSNRCPRFAKHWTCLETNCGLPVSKAWSNALSPTDTSSESPLHTQTWRNSLHPPWENYSWDGNGTPAPHPARSSWPHHLLPGQILIHSLTLGCTEIIQLPPPCCQGCFPNRGRVSEARAARLSSSHGGTGIYPKMLHAYRLSS